VGVGLANRKAYDTPIVNLAIVLPDSSLGDAVAKNLFVVAVSHV
jgi:hypothetical protein